MKTKRQFILDTLLPYKNDPSLCAVDEEGNCVYLTKEGKKCALGVHMNNGVWQSMDMDAKGVLVRFGEHKVLKKEALEQKLTIEEWDLIQGCHDSFAKDTFILLKNKTIERLEKDTDLSFPELKFN